MKKQLVLADFLRLCNVPYGGRMQKKSAKRIRLEKEIMDNLDSLYRYALHLSRNSEDASDLVQETCVRSLRAADRFREGTNPRAWLFTIMKNIFLNQQRAKKRSEISSDWTDEVESGDRRFTGSIWPQPFELFLRELIKEDIETAMDTLNDNYRNVFVLCDIEGFSYVEAAEHLSIPVGTVRSRLHRARAAMQSALSQWFNQGLEN
ncbi:RNA polymerase subunit sigma [Candidatus Fermentibacteria bacterium]|nr:MAG: RNA polymerase subunit sigma [Candidatus Fermentibacteria bacterium]